MSILSKVIKVLDKVGAKDKVDNLLKKGQDLLRGGADDAAQAAGRNADEGVGGAGGGFQFGRPSPGTTGGGAAVKNSADDVGAAAANKVDDVAAQTADKGGFLSKIPGVGALTDKVGGLFKNPVVKYGSMAVGGGAVVDAAITSTTDVERGPFMTALGHVPILGPLVQSFDNNRHTGNLESERARYSAEARNEANRNILDYSDNQRPWEANGTGAPQLKDEFTKSDFLSNVINNRDANIGNVQESMRADGVVTVGESFAAQIGVTDQDMADKMTAAFGEVAAAIPSSGDISGQEAEFLQNLGGKLDFLSDDQREAAVNLADNLYTP